MLSWWSMDTTQRQYIIATVVYFLIYSQVLNVLVSCDGFDVESTSRGIQNSA